MTERKIIKGGRNRRRRRFHSPERRRRGRSWEKRESIRERGDFWAL